MGCFCIKGIPGFDYQLVIVDNQNILFTDMTTWMDEETYSIPQTYSISLVLPDSSEHIISVNAANSTLIKASDLGIARFKDGIYCFKIDPLSEDSGGCGKSYAKFSGIFPNLECCLDEAFSQVEEVKFDQVYNVKSWLDRAKMSAELDKQSQSLEEYSIAKKFLERLNCDCNCFKY